MTMMDEGDPPPDGPDMLPDEAANGGKQSQQEANYREGNPQRSWGLCGHFDSKGHSCDVVEGDISPFGYSDRYLRQDNPFRTGEKDSFKGGTKVAMIAPAAAVAGPPAGLLQIGRKTYGGEVVRAVVLGFMLLAANVAQAEDRKCRLDRPLNYDHDYDGRPPAIGRRFPPGSSPTSRRSSIACTICQSIVVGRGDRSAVWDGVSIQPPGGINTAFPKIGRAM